MNGFHTSKKHFVDAASNSPMECFFEQLHLDLEWAFDATNTFHDRDRRDPFVAAIQGINAIAGWRYSRFKDAEKDGNLQRAEEMHLYAKFWYKLAQKLEESRVAKTGCA